MPIAKIGRPLVALDLKKISAIKKGDQLRSRFSTLPKPAKPVNPAEVCRRESFAAPDLEIGDPLQVATEQACLDKAKQLSYFLFFLGAQGTLAKLRASPALTPKKPERQEKYSDDVLTISMPRVVKGEFSPEPNRGVSVFRPEILSILNFKPIYVGDPKEGEFSKEGKMLEIQHEASKIRGQSLKELNDSMKNRGSEDPVTADRIYKTMQENFQKVTEKTNQIIGFYKNSIEQVDDVSSLFDLKRTWSKNDRQNASLAGLKEFYDDFMGFGPKQFEKFSNTKIYVQMLSDFRQVMENYSFNLLDIIDSDRPNDFDPIQIDTSITLTDGFSFTSEMMRSNTTPINATNRKNSDRFLKSLPRDSGDKIKVLINFLSKEYRVSKAMGMKGFVDERLRADWGAGTQGTPFDNIIGKAGQTIFVQPQGRNSLLSLAYQPVTLPNQPESQQGEFIVLPFEEKYIDSEDRTFVPGTDYYVDRAFDLVNTSGIGNNQTNFNTGPIVEYVDRFQDRTRKAMETILLLFQINPSGAVQLSSIQPEIIYDRIANALANATAGIDRDSVGKQNKESLQTLSLAILRLSNKDRKLKNLLFQYLIVMGLLSNVDNNPSSIWADIAIELGDLGNLSEIKPGKNFTGSTNLLEGPAVVAPFVRQIAINIERRIRQILLKDLQGSKEQRRRARIKPDLIRKATSKFKSEGSAVFRDLDIPLASAINSTFIREALVQIANESHFEKDSNIFREYVDLVAKLTEGATSSGNNREYLLPDGTGRTRFNFVSTSHQMLIIFEILSAMADKFSFCDLKRNGLDLIVSSNLRKTEFIKLNIRDMAGSRFSKETTTLGGFSKALRASLGTDDPEEFAKELIGEVKTPPAGGSGFLSGISKAINEFNTKQQELAKIGKQFAEDEENKKPRKASEARLRDNLYLIRTKLSKENQIIVNFLWLLVMISQDLKNAKSKAVNYWNKNTLQNFLRFGTFDDLRIIRDKSQVRVASYLNDDLLTRARNSFANVDIVLEGSNSSKNPIVSNIVRDEIKEALYSYLKEPEFQESNQASSLVKIFSVGIPAEFIRNTQDRIDYNNINQNAFKKKEAETITINVHKRDLRRPELVFKPQKFLFDLSLFQKESDVVDFAKPEPGKSHDQLLQAVMVTDFENVADTKRYSIRKPSRNSPGRVITEQPIYDFLSSDEQIELIENHYQSFLLNTYIKMTTGMDISEGRFLISDKDPDEMIEANFEALMLSYIKDIQGENIPAGQSVQQLLNNPAVNANVKDLIRSITSGQALVKPETEKNRILRPKKFDRVFHFAVNIDDFEIDKKEMTKTEVGRAAFEKASLNNLFRTENRESDGENEERPIYFKKRTDRDIIFEDYFVTIETQND